MGDSGGVSGVGSAAKMSDRTGKGAKLSALLCRMSSLEQTTLCQAIVAAESVEQSAMPEVEAVGMLQSSQRATNQLFAGLTL